MDELTNLQKTKQRFIGASTMMFDQDGNPNKFNIMAVVEHKGNIYLGLISEDLNSGLLVRHTDDKDTIEKGISEHPEMVNAGAIPFSATLLDDDEYEEVYPIFAEYDFSADYALLESRLSAIHAANAAN